MYRTRTLSKDEESMHRVAGLTNKSDRIARPLRR